MSGDQGCDAGHPANRVHAATVWSTSFLSFGREAVRQSLSQY